jgi:alginate O-acetyltransferase complex protein AlgI
LKFDSLGYLVLLCVTFGAFRVSPSFLRRPVLIAASVVFYCTWNAPFILLVLLSAVVDFTAAQRIFSALNPTRKKLWLVLSLCVNLGILGYFKYSQFAIGTLHGLFPETGAFSTTWDVILPIGISFYTFQTMSYSIDVYRGTLAPTKNFGGFVLYVCFFPQLIAGPIERAGHLMPQILESSKGILRRNDFFTAVLLIVWGLFLKTALSDNLAPVVDAVYNQPEGHSGLALLLGTYAFAFQIFFDFAAYSNIARGSAQLFGIKLVRNFNLPYLAQNPSEFWRRWHISLSTWIRDYIFISLGGSRGRASRILFNLVLTMALAGLWHGASWNFCIWGLFHGLLLVAYRLLGTPLSRLCKGIPGGLLAGLRVALMFHLTCLGWVFFRAANLTESMEILGGIGAWIGSALSSPGPDLAAAKLILVFGLFFSVMAWQERRDVWLRCTQNQYSYGILLGLCLAAMALFKPSTSATFIYFQF